MATQRAPLQKNWIEWLVFVLGLILVAGVLGFLAISSLSMGNAPPDLKIHLSPAQAEGKYFRVPVKIKNNGDQTAEGVQIEVVFNEGKANEETATFEAAFLPRHSSREGAVIFKTDPRTGTLEARVLGYEKP